MLKHWGKGKAETVVSKQQHQEIMFRTATLRRSTSLAYACHRVRSPTGDRKQRRHERCRSRAQIPWYVVERRFWRREK